jgi:Eph receptor A3
MLVLLFLSFDLAAFSISGENSHVVMIAISAAVAIIVLTVVTYVLVGR